MNKPIITKLDVSNEPEFDNHKVFRYEDVDYDLFGIFSVHRMVKSALVKGLFGVENATDGGTRYALYSMDKAIRNGLRLAGGRLSGGMTQKAALAGLDQGGSKAIILGDPQKDKTPELLSAYGRMVDKFNREILMPRYNGVFMTGEDSGIKQEDADIMAKETPFIFGTSGGAGDPSPKTADGVVLGIKRCLKIVYGNSSLSGRRCAIQGIGNVGWRVAEKIYSEGGVLVVSDTDKNKMKKFVQSGFGLITTPREIHKRAVDVFIPCAFGGVLNSETIPELDCKIVAGSANNQLLDPGHALMLRARGILYATDFVENAGGLIHVYHERLPGGYDEKKVDAHVATIPDTLEKVFAISQQQNISTHQAAMQMANQVLIMKEMAWR